MSQRITCTKEEDYPLTRGQQYELLVHDAEARRVQVLADTGRRYWFPDYVFDLNGGSVPMLVAWRYDEAVIDALSGRDETNNWVDIGLKFNDGTRRWCQMATPEYLKGLLEDRPEEPMFYSRNLIVVRDLKEETVEQVLCHLDRQNELLDFSLPLEEQSEEEAEKVEE